MENVKVNKNVFNSDDRFNEFVDILKQASRVFKKRQNETTDEYKIMLEKKKSNSLNPNEEKRFFELYKRLISYGYIDNIPERLLESDFEKAVDDLIKDVESYVKKEGENG